MFELDGEILEFWLWNKIVLEKIESAVAMQRAVLVICEDISIADYLRNQTTDMISMRKSKATLYVHTKYDRYRTNNVLKPGDVVITTNLGARGTDFVTDDVVNKNGGLLVLVTFIPLNDRVEKQAFGRTGRRGATGSCQIIVRRELMPEWLRSCETVDKAKRLRDSIEMRRWDYMAEMILMRNKQKLFREYCELKNKFVTSSASESNDLKVQESILDEAWAKWIQEYERLESGSNNVETVQELRNVIEIVLNGRNSLNLIISIISWNSEQLD